MDYCVLFNENESLTGSQTVGKLRAVEYAISFFGCLINSVFYDTFVKRFMKKVSFFSSNFKNQFQDVVYYRKLGCLTL